MSVIRAMYEDATTKVRLNGRESNAFSVKVGYTSWICSQSVTVHHHVGGFV